MKARTAGGIDAVMKAINTHIDNADALKVGKYALSNITVKCKHTQLKKKKVHALL